ncbi:hypothetical protein LSTR_LSTR005225 [Laodelphax striatellus]|uniref:Uncharacterized protein n=1 Tax=Laodelphax striatellus TaxID=195883 RepID=A0A482XN31_LAOST|nr:hypothetical protein LSTR_LSTR005225 [Laodelphax striatellus]
MVLKETPERDEEDSVSLDPKAREWQVRAAQCNYQALAKMAGENHRLARLKSVPKRVRVGSTTRQSALKSVGSPLAGEQ